MIKRFFEKLYFAQTEDDVDQIINTSPGHF